MDYILANGGFGDDQDDQTRWFGIKQSDMPFRPDEEIQPG